MSTFQKQLARLERVGHRHQPAEPSSRLPPEVPGYERSNTVADRTTPTRLAYVEVLG